MTVEQQQKIVDSVMHRMALRHGSSTRRDFEVACLTVDELLLRVSQPLSEPEHEQREQENGAGLIHQTIPDMAGTEPRPNKTLRDMRRASALCDEMIGPGDYATRMIALALIARQYLREIGEE